MDFEVRVRGSATLRRVADQMRTEGRKSLARQMGSGLTKALEPVKVSIAREADEVMPESGGYQATFSRALAFRMSRRNAGTSATVILLVHADGTKQRRDIRALNRGFLRHPVYGRTRRIRRGPKAGTALLNPWSVTKIRSDFFRRGTDRALDESEKRLLEVVEEFAHRLAR